MILSKHVELVINLCKCPGISSIRQVNLTINYKTDQSTASRSFQHLISFNGIFEEIFFGLHESIVNCFLRIFRKLRILHDIEMKILFQKLSAILTAMSIVNSEKRTLQVSSTFLTKLLKIYNRRYPIFVIVSPYSLIVVKCKSFYLPISPCACSSRLEIGNFCRLNWLINT